MAYEQTGHCGCYSQTETPVGSVDDGMDGGFGRSLAPFVRNEKNAVLARSPLRAGPEFHWRAVPPKLLVMCLFVNLITARV